MGAGIFWPRSPQTQLSPRTHNEFVGRHHGLDAGMTLRCLPKLVSKLHASENKKCHPRHLRAVPQGGLD